MLKKLAISAGLAALTVTAAHAQSSLGIGSNEVAIEPSGPFAGLFHWINTQQKEFYRAMTGALRTMRDGGGGAWLLVGLSFAYGVFHAAGPGHGKAVISSYMLANEIALRRSIVLSIASAFLQAISALVVVGAAFLFLRGTTFSMDDATRVFEIASYALITAFGAWLLWQKTFRHAPAYAHSGHSHGHGHDHGHHHGHGHIHDHGHHDHHEHHHHAYGAACQTCGHSHAPDPKLIAREFNWKTASSAILAVGLRPCSGALIVLTFALLNGLYIGGILSVLAMALGTAITVSALATIAVTAKNTALRLTKATTADRIGRAIEIGGAAMVLILGLLLLGASLSV
jgi:ABC-type nickel/cobalt efflux system permease component RcnA